MTRQRFACVLAAMALTACGQAGARQQQPSERPAPPVYVAPAETQIVEYRIRTVGQLEPDEAVQVRSEVKGIVREALVSDGDAVAEGDVLFRLEDERASAALREAEALVAEIQARLVKATDDLTRDKELFEKGIIEVQRLRATESAYNAMKAALTAGEARVAQLREGLRDTVIRAPIAGEVGEREVYTGDYVEDGDPLVQIFRVDPLDLRFSVPERQVAQVRHGARVDFVVPGFEQAVFHGEIYYIAPQADMVSRNVAIKAHVPNADRRLRPGFFVKLQVITERRENAVVIPESAVVLEGSQTAAYVLRSDNTAERRNIVLGIRTDDGRFEITEGIRGGEVVLIRGQHGLPDGAAVRVLERSASDVG